MELHMHDFTYTPHMEFMFLTYEALLIIFTSIS